MTFEEILDQAIAMLQRRGRVSYRTLTLQFHLDTESLEALKEELLEVHHLAVDQGGRMLVWAGETRRFHIPPGCDRRARRQSPGTTGVGGNTEYCGSAPESGSPKYCRRHRQ